MPAGDVFRVAKGDERILEWHGELEDVENAQQASCAPRQEGLCPA